MMEIGGMYMKQLLTGNEAVARGLYEAGVSFASAYPGTPSTEILENAGTYTEIDAEWAPNEKVAMEAAIGASIAGVRSFAAMKMVGVNVAADPLFTYAYMQVHGGFVFVSADDPGMHSSQDEQDNRNFARFAKICMFEPSDSQEAKDMTRAAYDVSERFHVPVMVRMTTRICHSKSLVTEQERVPAPPIPYTRRTGEIDSVPAVARVRRVIIEQRQKKLQEWSETCPWNVEEPGDTSIGIVTKYPCALKKWTPLDTGEFTRTDATYEIRQDLCIGCRKCLSTGCPALRYDTEQKKSSISQADCAGCSLCAQVCPVSAVVKKEG